MKCPNCTGTLIKKVKTGEGIKYCPKCGICWFIILCSKNKEKSMWNKILNFIENLWEKQKEKEKPESINIEERIKNSKDYKNRYGG